LVIVEVQVKRHDGKTESILHPPPVIFISISNTSTVTEPINLLPPE